MISNVAKNLDILAISLNVLHYYFDSLIKLFSDLYFAKFLDTSAKSFFPCAFIFYLLYMQLNILNLQLSIKVVYVNLKKYNYISLL